MMREFCPRCGTTFDLERKYDGTVGRIEGVRWIKAVPTTPTLWRRVRWRLASILFDAATRCAR